MKVVVVGNGMVGQRFLEQLVSRMSGASPEVTVFCGEPRPAYDAVQVTSFFSGKSAADLSLVPAGFFEQHGIALRLGDKAVAIDRTRKLVRSARGHDLPYDKLVLATGSYPFVPSLPGAEWPDCFVYRAIEDLEAIRAAAGRARVGTVIGGGLLGLDASGECALGNGRLYGLVAPGYQMAEVAARQVAGEEGAQFLGADMSTKLKLMGVDVASIGDAHGATPNALNYVFIDEAAGTYKKLVVSRDRKYLLAAILLGYAAEYGSLLQMPLNPLPLPDHPEELILPAHEGARKGIGVEMLPDSALVCSCNGVSKGRIIEAIGSGCASLGALKKETKAATSCGGCGPLAKQILDAELKKRGFEVKNHLCEHFNYSRQELFHLARIGNLRTFDTYG